MDVEPDAPEVAGWTRGRMVGLIVGVAIASAIVALLVIGLLKPDDEFSIDRRIGENEAVEAPAVSLPVLSEGQSVGPAGAQVSLASLKGKPVVVNLWASWCPPCKSEAPILQRLATAYAPRGVVVLGINVRDISGDAKGFVKEFGLTFPSLRDGSDATERKFEATGLPETFIIDPDGQMRTLPYRGELTRTNEREIGSYLDKVLGP